MPDVELNFRPEECCEECNEISHTHFDCPACGTIDASTSVYGGGIDAVDDFDCEHCGTNFVRGQDGLWSYTKAA
jgi:transposase-like protein